MKTGPRILAFLKAKGCSRLLIASARYEMIVDFLKEVGCKGNDAVAIRTKRDLRGLSTDCPIFCVGTQGHWLQEAALLEARDYWRASGGRWYEVDSMKAFFSVLETETNMPVQKITSPMLPEPTPKVTTIKQAMEYLRVNHPDFFNDKDHRDIGAILVLEMQEELAPLNPVARTALLGCIMTMMYKMGSAALASVKDSKRRKMARIFVDNYRADSSK